MAKSGRKVDVDHFKEKLTEIRGILNDDLKSDHGAVAGIVEVLEDMLGVERPEASDVTTPASEPAEAP